MVTALTAQGMCLFVVFMLRPEMLRKRGALPTVPAVTVQGEAGTEDATTAFKNIKLYHWFAGFPDLVPLFLKSFISIFKINEFFHYVTFLELG